MTLVVGTIWSEATGECPETYGRDGMSFPCPQPSYNLVMSVLIRQVLPWAQLRRSSTRSAEPTVSNILIDVRIVSNIHAPLTMFVV